MRRPLPALLLFVVLAACGPEPSSVDYVARVDTAYFSQSDLAGALTVLPVGQDTADARRQILEQWITNTLLFNEAQRRGLRSDPEVQRLLAENERSVLVSAILRRLYDEEDVAPSAADVQAYFEQHRDGMRLREPFVRLQHLSMPDADSARAAARLMGAAPGDSAWSAIAGRFADEPDRARTVSEHFYAESRLFPTLPEVRAAVGRLRAGEMATVAGADGRYHVVRIAERAETGTVPELAWVEAELRQRLAIQARKQIYARQVQRLRNEALARDALEIR